MTVKCGRRGEASGGGGGGLPALCNLLSGGWSNPATTLLPSPTTTTTKDFLTLHDPFGQEPAPFLTQNKVLVTLIFLPEAVDVHFEEAPILGGCGDPCSLPLPSRSKLLAPTSDWSAPANHSGRKVWRLPIGRFQPLGLGSLSAPSPNSLSLTGDLQVNSCARPPHPRFEDLLTRGR